MNNDALIINCSQSELDSIHVRARKDRRKLSEYVLFVVMLAVEREEKLLGHLSRYQEMNSVSLRQYLRPSGPRKTFMIRCSEDESARIRRVAQMREMKINHFVLHSLSKHWGVTDRIVRTHSLEERPL